jgi:integrase
MSAENSPYIVGDYWLEMRADGRSPFWHIAWNTGDGQVLRRSTRRRELEEAKAKMSAYIEEQRSLGQQPATDALILNCLKNYWQEHGVGLINNDQTQRSLYTIVAFLLQDQATGFATVDKITPTFIERFRKWRMNPHQFEIAWFGKQVQYASEGVSGPTVQRNINDLRAAVYHAHRENRIDRRPYIPDLDAKYKSLPKDIILTEEEMGLIVWYAREHSKRLYRFVALQMATSVRPMAAKDFNPLDQYNARSGMIDLQPHALPQTKKRNAIIPCLDPLKPVMEEWASEGGEPIGNTRTAWRKMREVLGLPKEIVPKTIRYTMATWLYERPEVPERQISEMLGHVAEEDRGGLARTSRVYAKYRPERMGLVVSALTDIWCQAHRWADSHKTLHLLSTSNSGGAYEVIKREQFQEVSGGRGKD